MCERGRGEGGRLTIWESGTGWDGEVVEHEEGAKVTQLGCSNAAAYTSACAFGLFDREEGLLDLPWCLCREGIIWDDWQTAEHGCGIRRHCTGFEESAGNWCDALRDSREHILVVVNGKCDCECSEKDGRERLHRSYW